MNEPMKVATRHMEEPMKLPAPTPFNTWPGHCALQRSSNQQLSSLLPSSLLAGSTIKPQAAPLEEKSVEGLDGRSRCDSASTEAPTLDSRSPKMNSKSSSEDPVIGLGSGEDDVAEMSAASNIGSRGHPDFCPRPCLYFAQGTCNNGASCEFCHLDHERHPMHLDKRNRLSLGRLSFLERAKIILPVISKRAQLLNLPSSFQAASQLTQLINEHHATQELPKVENTQMTSRERKKLRHMLEGLKVQELIRRLKAEEASPSVQLSIEILACQMQHEGTKSAECPKTRNVDQQMQ